MTQTWAPAPAAKPSIREVTWVDGYGREYTLVPKEDLDEANERIRELTIDRDETEIERVKAIELEHSTAEQLRAVRTDRDGYARAINRANTELQKADIEAVSTGDLVRGVKALRQERDEAREELDQAAGALGMIYDVARGDWGPYVDPAVETADMLRELFDRRVQMDLASLPEEKMRRAADEVEALEERTNSYSTNVADLLRAEADRLEQSATRDEKLIDQMAKLVEEQLHLVLGHIGISTSVVGKIDWRDVARDAVFAAGLLSVDSQDGAA